MKMLLSVLIIWIVGMTLLLAVAIGIGFLLHWILPAIDIGIAVLIGVVVCGISINFLSNLMTSLPGENPDDEDGDKVSEKIYLIEPTTLKRRKRKVTR
jgi:divalent metal cation (Fe/Co/Zn/Cd) transporter